jgi:L-threonylcarbamoyladenylate synthase
MAEVSLQELIQAARTGDALISFPTDTVPALATRPEQAALIFQAKQRSYNKPLILMGATGDALWPFVQGTEEERQIWLAVAQTYWPGALTLVLPASDRLPPQLNPADPTTIGIRVPDRAIARCILSQTGPLATTSLNRSGAPPLETLAEINALFPQVLTLSQTELDDWEKSAEHALWVAPSSQPAGSGVPSTVAKWTGVGWEILRQGSITLS